MTDYKIRSNKYSKVQSPPDDVIGIWGPPVIPWVYNALRKITGYQLPLEEKEHVLEDIPGPDFEIKTKDAP